MSIIALCFVCTFVSAQQSLFLTIKERGTGTPIPSATVEVEKTSFSGKTDSNGNLRLEALPSGKLILSISHLAYQSLKKEVNISGGDNRFEILLDNKSFITDEVLVRATRAQNNTPTTFTNVSKSELAKNNLGQDLPYLLDQTPSVVVTSDAGAGVGYTGIRIRGADASRTNVTINGIPLNNPESLGAFLINLPDLASSVENVQIQRGAGTSTNGAGAFGASLNLQTQTGSYEPYVELDNSYGSYNTLKNTVRVGTGLIRDKVSFDARLSQIKSDGYMDRSFSDLQSLYLSGAYYGKKSLWRANIISGKEKTYQAWNGIPEEMLSQNRRYNQFTYENQTDNYIQTHYHLHYSNPLSSKWNLNAALHYTRGEGYYEEYKDDQSFANYGFKEIIIGGETINTTDLIRRRWLDNHFYGVTYDVLYTPNDQMGLTLGGAYNEYKGAHFGEVIWAEFASDSQIGDKYYHDDAIKNDFNIFSKWEYNLNNWFLYADLQYRNIQYTFVGFDRNLNNLDQTIHLNFFNPKAGFTYNLGGNQQIYASLAMVNKEPERDGYTDSSPDSRPSPERLTNLEMGYKKQSGNFQYSANLFGMFYKNQLILTGMINDVGSTIRMNVPESYRIGAELSGSWILSKQFNWRFSAAFSDNKIKNFVEYVDQEGSNVAKEIFYKSTHLAMSPSVVASQEMTYSPLSNIDIVFNSKYVGRQYLDNTSSKARSIAPYFVHNARIQYNTSFGALKNLGINLAINNLFGAEYVSNGYTFGYIDAAGDRQHYNYYFPQATTHFMLGLNLKF